MNNDCPCKDCEKRTVTCHYQGACEPWEKWKKEHEEKRERKRSEKDKEKCHSRAYERNYFRSLRRR